MRSKEISHFRKDLKYVHLLTPVFKKSLSLDFDKKNILYKNMVITIEYGVMWSNVAYWKRVRLAGKGLRHRLLSLYNLRELVQGNEGPVLHIDSFVLDMKAMTN